MASLLVFDESHMAKGLVAADPASKKRRVHVTVTVQRRAETVMRRATRRRMATRVLV